MDAPAIKAQQQETLRLWLGRTDVSAGLMGSHGGIQLTFNLAEDAARAIEAGLGWDGLNVRSRCRPFLPREDVTLQACRRCCGFGHPEARCPGKPICRSCGETGHCEVLGKCPNNRGPPPSTPRCIACGQDGHKHGSLTCKALQAARRATIPRPGQRIQERIRELKGEPAQPLEHSEPTPGSSNANFLEAAKKALRSSSAAPRGLNRSRLSMVVEEDEEATDRAESSTSSTDRERQLERQLDSLTAATNGSVAAAEKVTAVMAELMCNLEAKAQRNEPVTPADTVSMLHMMLMGMTTMLQLMAHQPPATRAPGSTGPGQGSSSPPEC